MGEGKVDYAMVVDVPRHSVSRVEDDMGRDVWVYHGDLDFEKYGADIVSTTED